MYALQEYFSLTFRHSDIQTLFTSCFTSSNDWVKDLKISTCPSTKNIAQIVGAFIVSRWMFSFITDNNAMDALFQ